MTFNRVRITKKQFPIGLLSVALLALGGCEKQVEKGAAKFPVSGTVLVNGKPAEGAIVSLHAVGDVLVGKDRRPVGVTDKEGHFHLATFGQRDGAPAGDFDVTIAWPYHPMMTDQDRLRGKYSLRSRSELRVVLGTSATQLPPFKLEVPSSWLDDELQKEVAN